MCDGVSEAALLSSVAATTAAATAGTVATGAGAIGGIGAATAATTAAAAAETTLATSAAATGLFGTGISGTTALGLGGTLASTGLSMMGRMAASAGNQNLYIQNAYNQNVALAQNFNGLGLRQSQIADKTATDNFDVLRGLAVAKGKATAAAGEAGVSGVSFSNVLSDLDMRSGLATGTNNYNYTAGIQSAQDEKESARSRTIANISGMPQSNSLGLFAGISADAINGGLKIYDIADKRGLLGSDKATGDTGNIKSA